MLKTSCTMRTVLFRGIVLNLLLMEVVWNNVSLKSEEPLAHPWQHCLLSFRTFYLRIFYQDYKSQAPERFAFSFPLILTHLQMSSAGELFDSPELSDSGSSDEGSSTASAPHSRDEQPSTSNAGAGCKNEGKVEDNMLLGNSSELMVWTADELLIVDGMKDKWFLGNAAEKKNLLEEAGAELSKIGSKNPESLKKKVRSWLNKKCSGRNKFGPGRPPSLRKVLYWYKQRDMVNVVKEKYGVSPGDKEGRFVGHLSMELGKYQRKLKDDPLMVKELDKFQKRREEWARVGVPGKRRKQ